MQLSHSSSRVLALIQLLGCRIYKPVDRLFDLRWTSLFAETIFKRPHRRSTAEPETHNYTVLTKNAWLLILYLYRSLP